MHITYVPMTALNVQVEIKHVLSAINQINRDLTASKYWSENTVTVGIGGLTCSSKYGKSD